MGHDADERMAAAAEKRDIHLTSKSRPLEPEDFSKFDYIIGMDYENSHEIKKAAQHWQDDLQKPLPDNWKDKVSHDSPITFDCHCTFQYKVTASSIVTTPLLPLHPPPPKDLTSM